MTISPDTRVEPALARYIYLTGTKMGELDEEDLPGYQAELNELLALHAALPPQDTPELSRAARALYIADHAHNPYAPGDWDNRSVPYAERRRYIGLARTTISTYHQEATK